MKVLLIGSGAREHAIAWKLHDSPLVDALECAPGNAGIARLARIVPIGADDVRRIAEYADSANIDLVVVGPEQPLALDLEGEIVSVSEARKSRGAAGIKFFGPSEKAARIESSKAFARDFAASCGIPGPRYAIFNSRLDAVDFIRGASWPFVIKASGLAAGKGVFLPESAEQAIAVVDSLLSDGALGDAGSELVIEERLSGEEVSILGFCDGKTVAPMPPAQDHKRLLEGDRGPNTGGMGAVASALPGMMEQARELSDIFLQPAVDKLAASGTPFVGVLYAGIMLTKDGPRLLEYNARFGDPEAEAILQLLDSDLAQTLLLCAEGRLDSSALAWKQKTSACVVLASEGYAISSAVDTPREIEDFATEDESRGSFLFHASTRREGKALVASGGRLLCAAASGVSVEYALDAAYARISRLGAERTRYRRDIGSGRTFVSGVNSPSPRASASAYAASGVDIDAGDKAVELMKASVISTYGPEVLAGIGAFGGVFDAAGIGRLDEPLLVASTDGVGTKVRIAAELGLYRGIGKDIVNHCIDDILVQGARPLFFLDYFATSKLDPRIVAQLVEGMSEACRESGCALIGGETAEMPGVYGSGEFDVAGAIVGVVEKAKLLPRASMSPGDLLLGIPSSGLHTNGFSLARKVFEGADLRRFDAELGGALGDALLRPHRSYLPLLWPLLEKEHGVVKGLAHITGGGFEGNVPRILPDGIDAIIDADSWPVPPLFARIMRDGNVDAREMYRVFNMGMGMVVVVSPRDAEKVSRQLGDGVRIIGKLVPGSGQARLVFGENET